MHLKLDMSGPYRSTQSSASRYPHLLLFTQAAEASCPGIYLQVVPLADAYRVAYVGETGTSFAERILQENGKWLSGTDQSRGETTMLYPAALSRFCRGQPYRTEAT